MECNKFDQYVVKMDGTGRLTKRNRKFLRRLTPITRRPLPTEATRLQPIPPPVLAQVPAGPPVTHAESPHHPTPVTDPVRVDNGDPDEVVPHNTLRGDELNDTVPDHAPPPPHPQPQSPPGPPTTPAPQLGTRPQRARKQNVKYSSDEWDLGPVTYDQPTRSHDRIDDTRYLLAPPVGPQQESQP